MKLMLIGYTDSDDDGPIDFDLFVIAEDRAQAVKLWREYYGEYDSENNRSWATKEPNYIHIVPHEELLNANPHAVPWIKVEVV